jgi:hypothetical protein
MGAQKRSPASPESYPTELDFSLRAERQLERNSIGRLIALLSAKFKASIAVPQIEASYIHTRFGILQLYCWSEGSLVGGLG